MTVTDSTDTRQRVDSEETLEARVQRLERTIAMLREQEKLLAAENLRLADLLKEHGITARVSSHLSRDLPPALTQPADRSTGAFTFLTAPERALLDEALGGAPAIFLARSGTRVDVGQWLQNATAWLCATPEALVIAAAGKKPFVARVPYAMLQDSLYNHVMGALALSPARGLAPSEYRMTPAEGYQLLAQIYREVHHA